MILFHGSTCIVEQPELKETQRFLDFGAGFYTTTNQEQAARWALIKHKRSNDGKPIVTVYEISDKLLEKHSSLNFTAANIDWLHFIIANRRGLSTHTYHWVKGPVANDTLYATLSLYETGILTLEETLSRLKTHTLFDQISFHKAELLRALSFIRSYDVPIV